MDDAAGVEVGEAFQDPEGDTLTYTASSSATSVVTVSVSGSRVTLTPVGAGTATITVTATDTGGSMAGGTQTLTVTVQPSSTTDYDTDDDGLIEITTLVQFDAIRHDLNGDGEPTTDGATAYAAAFPAVGDRQACGGLTGCVGYELEANLDFDTNNSGAADAGDTYWNGGKGWEPFESDTSFGGFRAIFEGNGHTIANLFIDRDSDDVGLFGRPWRSVIRHVGLIDVEVSGGSNVGGLAGTDQGSIIGSYVTGTVTGTGNEVGGLAGSNWGGPIVASYAAVEVTGGNDVGGLIGENQAVLAASYATGRVTGEENVGGLVGSIPSNGRTLTASYATGLVTGESNVGGLVGRDRTLSSTDPVIASYWDTTTSRQTTSDGGRGRNTAALQAPMDYTGIYSQWNVDLDGDDEADDPWDFGLDDEYPVLAVDFDRNGDTTWQEFGYQLRAGPPNLTATSGPTGVTLEWGAVDTMPWNPSPPAVTYTVIRDDGSMVEVIDEALSETTATDTAVPAGMPSYQVAAVVNGGEATRSGPVTVTAPNHPPTFDDGASTTRRVAENTPRGRTIGDPVTATDPENNRLTYSLADGLDKNSFDITSTGRSAGQLRTKAALDHETKDTYQVDVSVHDRKAADHTEDTTTIDDTIRVTITVTDVNEAPAFDANTTTTYSVAETPLRDQHIATFVATDPDTQTPAYADLTYRLSGSDAAVFLLNADSGQLQTRESLDYEAPTDSNRDKAYQVTVEVRDDPDDPHPDDTISVTITVINVNEAGLVALSSSSPQEKQELTAMLSDLDGRLSGISWQWARAATRTGTGTPIPGTTSSGTATATYTPEMDDVGQYVRATATYTDVHGMQAESATTTDRVLAAPQVSLKLSSSSITEKGGVSTVTATLAPAVSVDTRVTVSATAVDPTVAGDFTLSSNRVLTIQAHQTSSEEIVTLTAKDNDVDGPQETKQVTVTGTLPPTSPVVAPDDVTLTITDNDARGVTVTPTELGVNEGASADYEVALTSRPTGAVTVEVTAPTNTDVTVDRTELVFQPGRWNTAQTVKVEAAEDTGADDESATITHTVSGGDYAGETAAAVEVTVEDDEAESDGVVLTVNPETVSEGARRTTVEVTGTLNGATRMDETEVSVEVTPGTDFTADPPSFTPDDSAEHGERDGVLHPNTAGRHHG